jgi:hypothetical protein
MQGPLRLLAITTLTFMGINAAVIAAAHGGNPVGGGISISEKIEGSPIDISF